MISNNDGPTDKQTLIKRAETGDSESQYLLAISYLEPDSLNADEAVKWLESASIAGHIQATFKLAEIYERGGIVKQNVRTAAARCRLAAEAGLVDAYMMMAKMLLLGKGTMQDPDEAVEWKLNTIWAKCTESAEFCRKTARKQLAGYNKQPTRTISRLRSGYCRLMNKD
jgi:hypothetical protein